MNIIEKLKQLGVEVTQEIEKAFTGEFLSELEVQKKLTKAEKDRDDWKERAEEAEGTLKGFEGKDFDTIQKERDEWKIKAETAEADYKKQLHERDYADAVEKHVNELKFTSESAKKSYIADLTKADLTMKDGKIFGLTDFHTAYAEGDPSAFVTEEQQRVDNNKAAFTSPMGTNQKPGGKYTPEQIMKMKNENPALDISQYM